MFQNSRILLFIFWFRDHHTSTFRHFFTDVHHSTSIFPSLQWCQISLTSQCLHRGVATVVKDSCAGRPVSKTLLQKIRWIRSRRRRKMLLSWCRPEGNAFVWRSRSWQKKKKLAVHESRAGRMGKRFQNPAACLSVSLLAATDLVVIEGCSIATRFILIIIGMIIWHERLLNKKKVFLMEVAFFEVPLLHFAIEK